MAAGQSPTPVAAVVLTKLEAVFKAERPDWVLVQGDTTTVLAAAIGAFYARIKIGHVEAGLRTHDKYQPFPEEINRQMTSVATDLHFAPTACARDNLLREGIPRENIRVTGNPVIDALYAVASRPYDPVSGPLEKIPWNRRLILVTAHRRENFGKPLEQICLALRDLAGAYPDDVHIIYSVHPNVQEPVKRLLGHVPGITLMDPLNYLPLVYLMKRSTIVLTDSGGLQEEAPGLGKPVLVLREVTERPEAVEAGTVRLVGTDRVKIVENARNLLNNPAEYQKMAHAVNPYGDGHAAERIVQALLSFP
jgi:UDP-N-acetylglucosamine 2-epimerase (non-hydrolysing)